MTMAHFVVKEETVALNWKAQKKGKKPGLDFSVDAKKLHCFEQEWNGLTKVVVGSLSVD